MATPLAHLAHDQRQIPLLMADRLTDPRLDAAELVPAPAAIRQAIHRPAGQLIRLGRRPARSLIPAGAELPVELREWMRERVR